MDSNTTESAIGEMQTERSKPGGETTGRGSGVAPRKECAPVAENHEGTSVKQATNTIPAEVTNTPNLVNNCALAGSGKKPRSINPWNGRAVGTDAGTNYHAEDAHDPRTGLMANSTGALRKRMKDYRRAGNGDQEQAVAEAKRYAGWLQPPVPEVVAVNITNELYASDKRSQTSSANGAKGGRPKINVLALLESFTATLEARGECLRYWRDTWYLYREGVYAELKDVDVQERIVSHLHSQGIQARQTLVKEFMLNGLPRHLVPSHLQKPCWPATGKDASGWTLMQNMCVNAYNLAACLTDKTVPDDDCGMAPTPELFSTAVLPFAFEPGAKAPRFLKYLEEVQPDPAIREQLLMLMGLCLIDCTDYNAFFVLTGEGGCGKGVYTHLLSKLVGEEQTCCVPLSRFTAPFQTYPLTVNRLNLDNDLPESEYGKSSGCEGVLKKVTTGELVDAERKNKPAASAPATARCVFVCNKIPYLRDRTQALWDRLRIISFNVRIRHTERDNIRLRYELEEELPGIFNIAVKALSRLLKLKFFPDTVDGLLMKDKERVGNDPFLIFFDEKLKKTGDETDSVSVSLVYRMYQQWAAENGCGRRLSSYHLADAMTRQKLESKPVKRDGKTVRCWIGVTLRGECESVAEDVLSTPKPWTV